MFEYDESRTMQHQQQQQQQQKHTSERHRLNPMWIPNVRFNVFEIVSVRGPTGKKRSTRASVLVELLFLSDVGHDYF